jgi:predicted MFS family arabinose efflux permease
VPLGQYISQFLRRRTSFLCVLGLTCYGKKLVLPSLENHAYVKRDPFLGKKSSRDSRAAQL